MTRRTLVHAVLLAALAGFYGATAYVALHPRVSEHYRDYYIRRATTDWKVAHGPTSLADGFDFSQMVYPREVDYMRGLSAPEPWGRWSDPGRASAVSIRLRKPLSGTHCLDVMFRATPSQAGAPVTIQLGGESATVVPPDTEPRAYRLELWLTTPAWSIDLEPASASRRAAAHAAIGLIHLTLRSGSCPGGSATRTASSSGYASDARESFMN